MRELTSLVQLLSDWLPVHEPDALDGALFEHLNSVFDWNFVVSLCCSEKRACACVWSMEDGPWEPCG